MVERWEWSVSERWTIPARRLVVVVGQRSGELPAVGEVCFVRHGSALVEAKIAGFEHLHGGNNKLPYDLGLDLSGVTIDDVPIGAVISGDRPPLAT